MTSQLGYPTIGSAGNDQSGSGTIVVSGHFTTDGSGGVAGSGWAHLNSVGGGAPCSQKCRLVIYNDATGAPGTTLIGITDEVIVDDTTTPGWIEFPAWTHFGGPPTLAASTKYWVGIFFGDQSNGGQFNIDFDTNAPDEQAFDDTLTYSSTANPATPTFGQPGNFDNYSLYFDYAAGGTTHTLSLNVSQSSSVAFVKTPARTLSVTQPQSVTLTKLPGRKFAVTQAQAVTFTPSKVSKLTLAVSQSQAVALLKQPGKLLKVTSAQTVTLAAVKAAVRTFTVSQAQSVTLAKQAAKTLKVTQSSSLTFSASNAILRTFTVAQSQAVALVKQAARVFAVSQSSTVVKEQATVQKTMAVSQPQSVTLTKLPGKTLKVTSTSTPTFVGSLAHLRTFAVSQTQTVTLVKSQAITLRATATASVTTTRRAARSFLVAAAQTVSVVLQKSGALVGRLYPFDAPNPEAGSFDESSPTARTLRPK